MKIKLIIIFLLIFIISTIYYIINKSTFEIKGTEDTTVLIALISSIVSLIGTILTVISQVIGMYQNAKSNQTD